MKACKIDDEAFAGKTPAGTYTLVKVAEKPSEYEGNSWVPVSMRNKADGLVYDFSLKGLLRAVGITWKTRKNEERIKALLALEGKTSAAATFEFEEKRTRTDIRKRKTASGEKGSEYTINEYVFKNKVVG